MGHAHPANRPWFFKLFLRNCGEDFKPDYLIVGWAWPTLKEQGFREMPFYIRAKAPGGSFFFTVVTFGRRKILTEPISRQILREVIKTVRQPYPFEVEAWVLLPDHLHCLWTLPAGDNDFSKRWGLIKAGFSRKAKSYFQKQDLMTDSKERHRENTIWQRRFWEHQIRDERDFERYFHYIHYNPVKHGLVTSIKDWPFSTFHRYVNEGLYSAD